MSPLNIINATITPKEFTRLWNHVLKGGKKELSQEENLPKVILCLDNEPGMYSRILFIVERLNQDREFQIEMSRASGRNICLSVVQQLNQVQIIADENNDR